MTDTQRSRTVTWEDPAIGLQAAQTLSGFEYLSKIASGELPPTPIGNLLGFDELIVEDGRVTVVVTPAEHVYNLIGVVHGGFTCTVLDTALACAIYTKLGAGIAYTTIELHVNFVRPITVETGQMRAIGEVIHMGRRMATAQGRFIDANGKLYAHATTTCMVFTP